MQNPFVFNKEVKSIDRIPSHKDLDEKYAGKLDIRVSPYTEFSESTEQVLDALAAHALYKDGHNKHETAGPNPYQLFALFQHRGILHVCPVHRSYPTCLNPVTVEDGQVYLNTGSVGAVIYAHQLNALMNDGYIKGIVKVL